MNTIIIVAVVLNLFLTCYLVSENISAKKKRFLIKISDKDLLSNKPRVNRIRKQA